MRSWPQDAPDDVTAAVVTLERRFPGASVWFGQHTFRWWAVVPGSTRWMLVEAMTPMQLADRMAEVLGSAVPGGVVGPRGVR